METFLRSYVSKLKNIKVIKNNNITYKYFEKCVLLINLERYICTHLDYGDTFQEIR